MTKDSSVSEKKGNKVEMAAPKGAVVMAGQPLPEGAHTLTALQALLPVADEAVRACEFGEITRDYLIKLGKKAASPDIVDAVPALVASAWTSWGKRTPTEQSRFIGFRPEYLPVMLDEALKLDALYGRFMGQDAGSMVEVGRRRRALSEAVSTGVAQRDQCARALRRRMRGDDPAITTLEAATGTADEPVKLVNGLRELAKRVRALREGQSAVQLGHLDSLGFRESYAVALEAQADVVKTAENEARVAVTMVVTQDELDEQDGRVLHLADCVWRAFRDTAPFVPGLEAPTLGAIESTLLATRSAGATSTGGKAGGDGKASGEGKASAPKVGGDGKASGEGKASEPKVGGEGKVNG